MPEPQDQSRESGNMSLDPGHSLLNGTGKQRTPALDKTGKIRLPSPEDTGLHRVPPRPANMPRVSAPPPTPRVARPQKEQVPAPKRRRRLLLLGGILAVCAVLAFVVSSVIFGYAFGQSTDPGNTVTDFLDTLSHQQYDQAYKDLGPAITLHMSSDQFKHQAQTVDNCYGAITDYSEVQDSATMQGNNRTYTYTVTRARAKKPYQIHLTLQQDQDGNGWKIADYGGNLAPNEKSSVCK